MIGTVVSSRYELRRLIGEGGAACVYEALDRRLGSAVAVKVLRTWSPLGARRLEREARVAAALGHPHACLVTDLGALDDGRPYLVMELLQGITLRARLRLASPLDPTEATALAEQALSVLSVAHARGIVHRDLKPDNLFFAAIPFRAPMVKVLDFGAATEDVDDALTAKNATIGTAFYMSPEQVRGELDIDGRSDLYSLAAVLFECLTGERPFPGTDERAVLARIAVENPRRLAPLRPDLPRALTWAIDRALDVARDARFATAAEFLEGLGPHGDAERAGWDDVSTRRHDGAFDAVTARLRR